MLADIFKNPNTHRMQITVIVYISIHHLNFPVITLYKLIGIMKIQYETC